MRSEEIGTAKPLPGSYPRQGIFLVLRVKNGDALASLVVSVSRKVVHPFFFGVAKRKERKKRRPPVGAAGAPSSWVLSSCKTSRSTSPAGETRRLSDHPRPRSQPGSAPYASLSTPIEWGSSSINRRAAGGR